MFIEKFLKIYLKKELRNYLIEKVVITFIFQRIYSSV